MKTFDTLVNLQLKVEPGQKEKLARIARKQKKSMSAIIRSIIDRLREEEQTGK